MPWITREGRTVEEAQDAAIAEAGAAASDLDIEIVNEGAKGLFGLGGEPAVVRVRRKDEATDYRSAFQSDVTPARDEGTSYSPPAPVATDDVYTHTEAFTESGLSTQAGLSTQEDAEEDGEEADGEKRPLSERHEEAAQLGVEIVRGILERMELEGEISTRVAGGTVYIEISGEEMGILIGRTGTTLEALQELVRAAIQRRLKTRQAVVVDVESYWERRRKPQQRREGGNERRGGGAGGGGRRRGGRRGGNGGAGGGGGRRRGSDDPNRVEDAALSATAAEPDGNRLDDDAPEPDGNR